jgi:hypothetical protein
MIFTKANIIAIFNNQALCLHKATDTSHCAVNNGLVILFASYFEAWLQRRVISLLVIPSAQVMQLQACIRIKSAWIKLSGISFHKPWYKKTCLAT